MAQLMPLPLTVSCFSKIRIGFTFLVPAHLGSPGQRAIKRVCKRVCVVFGFEICSIQQLHTLHCEDCFACTYLHLLQVTILILLGLAFCLTKATYCVKSSILVFYVFLTLRA